MGKSTNTKRDMHKWGKYKRIWNWNKKCKHGVATKTRKIPEGITLGKHGRGRTKFWLYYHRQQWAKLH